MGNFSSRMASSSSHNSTNVSNLGSTGGGHVGVLIYQSIPTLLLFGKSFTSGSLWVEDFQPIISVLSEFCTLSFNVSSDSSVQIYGRTFHRLIHTSDSYSTLLDEGSLDSQDIPH